MLKRHNHLILHRLIALALCLILLCSMAAGCGKKPADGTDKDSNGSTSQEGTGSGGHDGKEEDSITFMAPAIESGLSYSTSRS